MVAYSFQTQFVEPIRIGLTPGPLRPGGKRHTIRSHGKRRHARPSETLQLYRGMRTKQCFLIGTALCVGVPPISIFLARRRAARERVEIGGRGVLKTAAALDDFAVSDGFHDWAALREFWAEHHPGITDFDGIMIEWQP